MSDEDQEFNFQNTDIAESTDMKVDMFANSEKTGPKDQRWSFSKDDNNHNDDDDVDEDINSYKREGVNINKSDNKSDKEEIHNDNRDNGGMSDKNEVNEGKNHDDDDYESLSVNEKRLRRLEYMRKLGELRDLGCKVTNYSINDDYYMMKYEYELHTSIRTKRNWMQLYNHILIGAVKGVELVNNRYNPFDFSLKGLSNEVSSDKNTYYEILGEIYEHYNVPGKKMNPWMRLFVTLIGTVVIVGGKNNAHKFIPGVASKVENDEALLEKLRAKAAAGNQSQPNQSQLNQSQPNQTQPNQTQQVNNGFDDLFEKEHNNTVQKIKDLEELKRQELEYQQLQKMLAEDDDKFNKIKQRLEMSQQSPQSDKRSSDKRKTTNREQKQFQPTSVRESDSRSTLSNQSNQSNQSSQSVISINKTLQTQLNKNVIKPSSISFGSSSKGKKKNINIGTR